METEYTTTSQKDSDRRIVEYKKIADSLGKPAERVTGSDSEILSLWKQIIPQSQWGEVSLTSPNAQFTQDFNKAIKTNTVDEFLETLTEQEDSATQVYVMAGNPSQYEAGSQPATIISQHTPEFLTEIETKLREFETQVLTNSSFSEELRSMYRAKIEAQRNYLALARSLGTPDFTALQKPPSYWPEQLDIDASKKSGTVVLRYEQQARDLLQKAKEQQIKPLNMSDALNAYHLSEAEKLELGYEAIYNTALLTPEQGKKLFEVLGKRISDSITVIDSVRPAINTEAKKNQLEYPQTRTLTPDEVLYLPAHEFLHLIRGINGYKQQAGICGEGEEEYLETEEGLAVLMEMILGQPFGHSRQQEFAGRYLAVSMALKTQQAEDGSWQASYSTQDIYNELINLGISPDKAASAVWRVIRGTSLKRQTVELQVGEENNAFSLHIAEAFEKDTVYFRGMMKLFEWARSSMPVPANMNISLTAETLDFSPETLKRIGATGLKGYTEMKTHYHELEGRGREYLLTMLNYLLVGKMKFESIMDTNSPWNGLFTRDPQDGIVNILSLFSPK
jgi:hypothetical protein